MPSNDARRVFEGLKVADFSWVAVGPLMSRYLADLGATVVQIESAQMPDIARTSPPFVGDVPGVNRSGWPTEFKRNKFGISLNLKHPKGIEVARKLVAWADVMLESFAPGVAGRLGLAYEDVRKINPNIVMVSASLQGQTGPGASHAGYGVQMTALAGFIHLTGWPDRGAVELYGAYTDYISPRFGATALMAALDYRRRTGKGQYIDLSQYEASTHYLAPLILDYEVNKRTPGRMGNQSECAAPHGGYRCRGNDRWCVIAVRNDIEWDGFCKVAGSPDWTRDRRFATILGRLRNVDEMESLVESWTIGHTAEEVMIALQAAGVPAGVIETGEDLHSDPQTKHRQHLAVLEHPEQGKRTHSTLAFKLSKTPAKIERPAPLVGQYTEYVCTKILGIPDGEFVELLGSGAFS